MLLGPAASGKSTQAAELCERFRLPYINVGQLLREAVYDSPTAAGLRCQKFINASKPVPDAIMLELLRERLLKEDCRRCGWLIDGFAHTHKQAEALAAHGIVPDKARARRSTAAPPRASAPFCLGSGEAGSERGERISDRVVLALCCPTLC